MPLMDYKLLHEKKFALAVITKADDGKDDLEFFPGKATWDGTDVTFHPESGDPPFLIPSEYLEKIEPVKEETKEFVKNAEYMLTLRMNVVPGEDSPTLTNPDDS